LDYTLNNNVFEDNRIKITNKLIDKDTVYLDLVLEPKDFNSCPICMCTNVVKNGHKMLFPILEIIPHYKNICRLSVQRFKCNRCGKSFLDESKLTFKNNQISKSTIFQILLDLKEDVSFTYIAKKNNVSIQTVINIFDKYVSIPKMKLSETICIDEFKNLKSAKGKYAFLVLDPINHKVIEVLESRLHQDISKYFYSLGYEERSIVKYVVSDMNDTYRYIVSRYFPNATYVVDAFHYLRYIEDAFNKVRIRIMNKYPNIDSRYKMLKRYWKVLSNYNVDLNTTNLMNYMTGLVDSIDNIINDSLLIDNELFEAYNLLQDFLYQMKNLKYEEADSYLDNFIDTLYNSSIPEFQILYKMFSNWKKEIVNSFIRFGDKRLSNGPIEGINNHIKEIKRIAFGYRVFKFFRKRIMYIINNIQFKF